MFSPQIEVVLLVKESCFGELVSDVFNHILVMNLLKNGDCGVGLIDLSNMVKTRSVIPPVAHFIELA